MEAIVAMEAVVTSNVGAKTSRLPAAGRRKACAKRKLQLRQVFGTMRLAKSFSIKSRVLTRLRAHSRKAAELREGREALRYK